MVIEILVPQGQPLQALGQKLGERMLDEAGIARVAKTRGQGAGDAQPVIDLAEQQHAAIAGEVAGGKIGAHFAGAQVRKKQWLFGPVCHAESAGQYRAKPLLERPPNTLLAGGFFVGFDLSRITHTLSRWEREFGRPSSAKDGAFGLAGRRVNRPPLPAGEGWGGEERARIGTLTPINQDRWVGHVWRKRAVRVGNGNSPDCCERGCCGRLKAELRT